VFRTKPQLAIDIITDAIADQTMPPWCAGDEVYGRSGQLRQHLQDHQIGEPPTFRTPDPIRSGPGTEDDQCRKGAGSSVLNSRTRP